MSTLNLRDIEYSVSVSPSDGHWVLEFEGTDLHGGLSDGMFQNFSFLSDQLHSAFGIDQLMGRLVNVLSVLSEYDRVMAYRFDAEWNGEVIAERIAANLDPYLGLRFPHWDIPPQARDAMLQFPVRYIHDVASAPISILAASPDDPPLDITFAQLRGTSPVHLQYLRNMGVGGTMTLSLVVENTLWGLISFHHQSAKLPSAELRQLCSFLAPIIKTKLEALRSAQALDLHGKIDRMLYALTDRAQTGALFKDAQNTVDVAMDSFPVDGFAMGLGAEIVVSGNTPTEPVLHAIRDRARLQGDGIWHTQCLIDAFPDHAEELGDVSGAMCLTREEGRWICLLRNGRTGTVSWAGAPTKELDLTDGMARLNPRGSFSLYEQVVKNTSEPWFEQDIALLKRVALSLLATVERSGT